MPTTAHNTQKATHTGNDRQKILNVKIHNQKKEYNSWLGSCALTPILTHTHTIITAPTVVAFDDELPAHQKPKIEHPEKANQSHFAHHTDQQKKRIEMSKT